MSIRGAIEALVNDRRDLTEEEAGSALADVFSGEATPAQLAAFLIALRLKGETVDEIAGMARVMRKHALPVTVDGPLVDTCGTGGDGSGSFNVSTTAAFVLAGAGVSVAKHGNRAMTSGCGSADVLEALGAKIDLEPEQVARCIRETGFGFMFAQAYHPAMKYAAGPRRELGVRTVFNILGPLTNPAGARSQLLGVARPELAEKLAAALQRLGSHHVLVVHGDGGVDEVALSGPTKVHEVKDGTVRHYEISPQEAGIKPQPTASIKGGTPEQNAAALVSILQGQAGPLRDVVVLNAAAALIAADAAPTLADGARIAEESIDSGAAAARMKAFVELTKSFA